MSIFNIFGQSKFDKAAKKVEEEEAEKKKAEYNAKWAKVVSFPGDISDYEIFKKYESGTMEFIDIGTTDQCVRLHETFGKNPLQLYSSQIKKEELIDIGVEAILKHGCTTDYFYGSAIRRKDWNDNKKGK